MSPASELQSRVLTAGLLAGLWSWHWRSSSSQQGSSEGVCSARLTALGLPGSTGQRQRTPGVLPDFALQRSQLYRNMSRQVVEHGMSAGAGQPVHSCHRASHKDANSTCRDVTSCQADIELGTVQRVK